MSFTEHEKTKQILAKPKVDRSIDDLAWLANEIRKYIVDMVYTAGCGHPGGALGLADIYSVLYFKFLNYDTEKIGSLNRDRVILSNGHVCTVKYAAMAMSGLMPIDELKTFRKMGSKLQGHPSTKFYPEVEQSSGSLGQGLSNACGLSLGLRLQKSNANVFTCMSDGECQEGMTWEAAMAAAHHKVDNVIPFLDYNNIQIDGKVEDVMNVADLSEKFKSFGWQTYRTSGHDIDAIIKAFEWSLEKNGKPKMIVFDTVLGKGVDFMENQPSWHGVAPNKEQRDEAFKQLTKAS